MVASSYASPSASFGPAGWVGRCSVAGPARPAARAPSVPRAVLDRGGLPRPRTPASTARPRRGLPGPASSSCVAQAARSRARSYTTAARRWATRSRSASTTGPAPTPSRSSASSTAAAPGHVLRARDRGSRKGGGHARGTPPRPRAGQPLAAARAASRLLEHTRDQRSHRGGDGLSALCVSARGGAFDSSVVSAAARNGMSTVLWDVDTRDWRCPAQGRSTAGPWGGTPRAIIVMHDGGGNRAQTLAALPHRPDADGAWLQARDRDPATG